MSLLSLLVGGVACWYSPEKRNPQILWITLLVVCMFVFIYYAAGHLIWATWIRNSAVIIWSNWTPIFAAAAAGTCWRLHETPRWRRVILAGALTLITIASVLWPFLGMALRDQPQGGNQWEGQVAMQTFWSTCSPAAGATFLKAGGVPASEAKLIPRCLTAASGTPALGLYRGVKITANESGRNVIAEKSTIDRLLDGNQFPAILLVALPMTGVEDPRYADEWGWIPGTGHSVVALAANGDGVIVGDPAVGREYWKREDLEVLWRGEMIRFANETTETD
ncbi:MAG: peptidase C39 [Rubripirellula sp.]|nr:peptidase C39 [Rubripirellula sp.]